MPNNTQYLYLKKLESWGVWKLIYRCMILLIIFLNTSFVNEIFSILVHTNEQRITSGRVPIPAECCWEYHGKINGLIYYLSLIFFYILFFLLSLREKNYFSKFIVLMFPLIFLFLLNNFFPRNI